MADDTAHYGALVRLQVTMSALQDLMWAIGEMDADPLPPAVMQAYENAGAAIQIALGRRHDVPERLMRNWRDMAMIRNASRALAASAGGA